jgi:division protein CdvB (Snf7/Vps24/ESCRT-III family)
LNPRLDFVIACFELQAQKLNHAKDRFEERDTFVFARLVNACTKHDTTRAFVFANELAEVHKIQRLIIDNRDALERKVLRLHTISILGEIVSTLSPAMVHFLIDNLPSSIFEELRQNSEMTLDFETVNKDEYRILAETAIVAERRRIKENAPNFPQCFPATKSMQSKK